MSGMIAGDLKLGRSQVLSQATSLFRGMSRP
jgi:hypothetical protein